MAAGASSARSCPPSNPNTERYRSRIVGLAASRPADASRLHLYCGGGFRSALAAEALVKMGYEEVYSIDGGWGVLSQILPTE